MLDLPAVSCICLTYARPALLEEAIHSFLRQEYAGRKELVVVNDYPRQQLVFEHPEVRVFNIPRRLRTVGEKMNIAVALAAHDLLFVWDDDDIYLSHRLSFSVSHLSREQGFFKPDRAWLWNSGKLEGPDGNLFHAASCWTRARFQAVGGYPADGTGYDLVFEDDLAQAFPGATTPYQIRPEEIYYLYRWGGTGSYHLSAFGQYQAGENVGHQEVESYVQLGATTGTIREGLLQLTPHWEVDYQQLVSGRLLSLSDDQGADQRTERDA